MSDDARQAVRNAWVDQQMAGAQRGPRTMRDTITAGIAAGCATAISTVIVSVVRWAIQHLLAS